MTRSLIWVCAVLLPRRTASSFAVQGFTSSSDLDGAMGVAVSGDELYVAARNAHRLIVVNVATPSNPTIVGSYYSSTYLYGAWDVAIGSSGNVYVSTYYANRFTVVDVSNPSSPSLRGSLYSPYFSFAKGLEVSPLNANIVFMIGGYYARLNAIDVVCGTTFNPPPHFKSISNLTASRFTCRCSRTPQRRAWQVRFMA